jgi:xylulose-5-phosphate/fructose-6-phosphate phosphoketolase
MNELDRFHLAKDAADAVYGAAAGDFESKMDDILQKHYNFIRDYGTDMPLVNDWTWKSIK